MTTKAPRQLARGLLCVGASDVGWSGENRAGRACQMLPKGGYHTHMTLRAGITALIVVHPQRMANGLLDRALMSVTRQTLQPAAIIVINDLEREGAGGARQKALSLVDTKWLAWLDSDDTWDPTHLQKLKNHADQTNSVYVFSWFRASNDPLGHFGKKFDPCNPHHTTITALVETGLAQEAGVPDTNMNHPVSNEDWGFISRISEICCERGWNMAHLPEITWTWNQHGQNSSGQPGKGDAR